jgi:hypothetical protein
LLEGYLRSLTALTALTALTVFFKPHRGPGTLHAWRGGWRIDLLIPMARGATLARPRIELNALGEPIEAFINPEGNRQSRRSKRYQHSGIRAAGLLTVTDSN